MLAPSGQDVHCQHALCKPPAENSAIRPDCGLAIPSSYYPLPWLVPPNSRVKEALLSLLSWFTDEKEFREVK